MDVEWRPTASLEVLRERARLLARARRFFAVRSVLEVETPMLSAAATPAPHLDSFPVTYRGPGGPRSRQLFLHTSPEFPMKRLLAAGSGSIYQLCKVFRDGESGPRHNPEFTLLEWYRVGFDLERLIDEVVAFLHALLGDVREVPTPVRLSYRGLFQRYAGIDGLTEDIEDLRACLAQAGHRIPVGMPDDDPDPWRDLILTHVIEGQLQGLHIVTDYPASQSALARLKPGQPPVAARFECYLDGLELANGFHELADASEQRRRFENENAQRVATGRASIPIDERLLQALTHDLPDCCGVALGFDRLLMWALGARRIEDVIAFDLTRA